MNLFPNFFISSLFYLLISYSSVFCRISDQRKCANADCSEPISLATTLIRYNADDDRLLSFPRNVKLKVYSKEAGDTPNFWEVEIYGKRGYVPKGLLREDKVLVPPSKLTHVVSTGRDDNLILNDTAQNVKEESNPVNPLSATPELPGANSKGLFTTIGGVSADSVPMNSPDIKPQSTRKFQVFEGTTLYDDVVSEKPESPPTVIKDVEKENRENNEIPASDPVDVPSSEVKPVTEVVNENELETGTDTEVKEEIKKEDTLKEENSDDESAPSEQTFFNSIGSIMSNMLSSGAGEDNVEEELEEEADEDEDGSAEEEDYDENEEEISKSEVEIDTSVNKLQEKSPSKEQPLETLQTTSPEALNSIDMLNVTSSVLEPSVLLSNKNDISTQEAIQNNLSPQNPVTAEENHQKESEKFKESSDKIKIEEIRVDKRDDTQIISEGKEDVTNEVEKLEDKLIDDSDTQKEKNTQVPEIETSTSYPDILFKTQNVEQHPDEGKIDDVTVGKETKLELTENQIDKASEASTKLESREDHDQSKTEELKTQKEPQNDDGQALDESTTENQEVEIQKIQDQSKNDKLPVKEGPEVPTISPTIEPPARQFLYGSRQSVEIIPQQDKPVSVDTSSSTEKHVDIGSNDSIPEETPSPDLVYSAVPTFLPNESPKYSSVVSKRIHSSETNPNEIKSDSEAGLKSETDIDHTDDVPESTPVHDEPSSPSIALHSQSPKYSSVVSNRIGSFATTSDVERETTTETESHVKPDLPESADVPVAEEKVPDVPSVETSYEPEKNLEEIEAKEVLENKEVSHENAEPTTIPDDVPPAPETNEALIETSPGEGMFSWVTSFFHELGSPADTAAGPESLETLQAAHFTEETCSAGGVEGSCPPMEDTMQPGHQVTWQETSYANDVWELMERVPVEATVWLIITAIVVLIFSLGHYYIEAHRRDGPLVAIINKLEREVLILKKESCILEDRLQIANQQIEAWNTSSTENDALLVELKQELEETKAAKAELEEAVSQLREELDTVTESGLEMHRLLEESLSSQDGSQVLLSTVETLREKLQRQEEEISGLSDTLSSKNAEVEELQGRLAEAAEVARSLEDKVISVTREKEEELLQLRDKHRQLISQLEEVMETKALEETRLSTEMSKLRLNIEELQKTLAEKDSELDTLKEVVKQLRATDSNEKIEALFDVVGVQAKLKTAVSERDDFREKFLEEEGARKLLEGHMKKITQEVADLKNSFETAEKEKIEALTKLQVLSNYFKEKESQLQKELGLQESMWLQKQSDDHTIYEQMRSLREENEKYKLQNESLKKEIVEQESSFKIQLANTEQKAHENWVASRQAERRLKEAQQEAAQLRNRLTTVEKNSANYSLDDKPNISESNGDPSSPPPSLMFPPTTSPPFMMYGPPMPPPGDFMPPPPLMGSPFPSDSRPPPLGRISSPPLDHRFSPPPPLPYPPYDYPPYGHHSPSPPPPLPPHHRTVHKPQPREMSREQKDHVPNYSPEAEKTSRRNKR